MVNYSELLQVLVSCLDASLEALTPPHPTPLPAQICGASGSFCFRSSVNRQQAAIGGKQLAGVHPKALFLSAWGLSGPANALSVPALSVPAPGSFSKQEPSLMPRVTEWLAKLGVLGGELGGSHIPPETISPEEEAGRAWPILSRARGFWGVPWAVTRAPRCQGNECPARPLREKFRSGRCLLQLVPRAWGGLGCAQQGPKFGVRPGTRERSLQAWKRKCAAPRFYDPPRPSSRLPKPPLQAPPDCKASLHRLAGFRVPSPSCAEGDSPPPSRLCRRRPTPPSSGRYLGVGRGPGSPQPPRRF